MDEGTGAVLHIETKEAKAANRKRVFLMVADDSLERELALKYACLRARKGVAT